MDYDVDGDHCYAAIDDNDGNPMDHDEQNYVDECIGLNQIHSFMKAHTLHIK